MKMLSIPVLFVWLLAGNVKGQEPPFSLTIVPENRSEDSAGISSGRDSNRTFYVILANKTDKPQIVFEQWNSWGYQTISFEITLPDGGMTKATKRGQGFTRNFPSTYLIPPSSYQVFPITFNREWNLPTLGQPGQTKMELKAVYSVGSTEESKKQKVWTGKVESEPIFVELNHW